MKKNLILTTLALFAICNFGVAQEKIHIDNVSAGDNLSEKIDRNIIFRFEQFVDGNVLLKDGKTTPAKLNYNTLTQEMQFIGDGDKILSLGKPENVEYITMGGKVFFHSSGKKFAELLALGEVQLLVDRRTESDVMETKNGAYGRSSVTSATTSYSSAMVDVQRGGALNYVKNLSEITNVRFKILDVFMLKEKGKFIKITGEKQFLKAFPKYVDDIKKYVASHKINFSNEQDLIKLTNFCNQLVNVNK